jgi:DNA-binding PadR family transcriptional regulator
VTEAILLLIAERPRNGYELIREIKSRSGGTWTPSPGSVYPALARLAEERLIRALHIQGHRVFAITDEGLSRIAKRDSTIPAPWDAMRQDAPEEVSALVELLAQVGAAVSHLADVGTLQQQRHAVVELERVRKKLYGILGDDEEAGPGEGVVTGDPGLNA